MDFHQPVLVEKVLELLVTDRGGTYVDATLGGGGHARAILEQLGDQGKVLGIDVDEEAVAHSRLFLQGFGDRITIRKGNFRDLKDILAKEGLSEVEGILLDLGVSSHQLDTDYRGFSYRYRGPLDMRMDQSQAKSAYQVINFYQEEKLAHIFRSFGEERYAQRIARRIVKERKKCTITDTEKLMQIISSVVPAKGRIKTLSRIFQALRIEVNEELENLAGVLESSIPVLKIGARMVIISYHSLEDRMVKQFFKKEENHCTCPPQLLQCICGGKGRLHILTKKVVKPQELEIRLNPRARSARLRAAERVG
ncbi:MAG: 16S rRNA (cytosine(1402)-N(4))-methyltransferase RsmH [candidate division KSB1 bacterium]|nr:16S rRNA (cytosine(1402)-N(4))-methyltransferase RsmH [candidate division KSB1 bacterium]